LFSEHPYLERVAAAQRIGFRYIETAWPDESDRDALPDAVAEHDVSVALLNCPGGDIPNGERGFINDPVRREEAELGFLAAAELAQRLGATKLNLLVGRALPGRLSTQRASVISALRAFGGEAAARGLRILLEPINAVEHPGYLAPTPRAAVELIDECGCDAVGLLLDVYHLAVSATDPLTTIDAYADLIGHVQIADWPGRGAPGTGQLDLPRVLERLQERGYAGPVGLEYDPRGPTEPSLGFLDDDARWPLF
jgi:hydroxypyruvate isomerase